MATITGTTGDDDLFGTGDADTITGQGGNDRIEGRGGADTIDGGDGADIIIGYDAVGLTSGDYAASSDDGSADSLSGGAGDDTILGGDGTDSISGGTGNDSIDGGGDADTIDGGSGDDDIQGGTGNDSLYGGDTGPAERLSFKWSDVPDPDNGGQIDDNDVLSSGSQTVGSVAVNFTLSNSNTEYQTGSVAVAGIDGDGTANPNSAISFEDSVDVTIEFSQEVQNVSFRLSDLDDGSDDVVIRAYDAAGNQITFNATPGANVTSADNDTVAGDETFGAPTTTSVSDTNLGASVLIEIPGPVARIEIEFNSPSSGTMVGSDIYFDDPVAVPEAGGNDTLSGGDGDDVIDGGDGDDRLYGEGGADSIEGGAGQDFLFGGDGNDTLSGGDGNDLINGQFGDDYIEGGTGADNLYGNAGNDTILGGTGADYLFGGTGADSIDGGDDSDTIFIENSFGNDTIVGGEGGDDDDTIDLSPVSGPVTVTYTGHEAGTITDGTSTITFSEIENLILTNQDDMVDASASWDGTFGDNVGENIDARGGNDTVIGGNGGDTIDGGAGNDLIDGDYGDDSLAGGDGADTLTGENGNDTIDGGAGDDSIDGGDEADTISGGDGNDTLTGGSGDDIITTGAGDDLVVLEQVGANDTVTDFDISDTDSDGNSNDQLDVSDLRDLDGNPVNIWDVVVTDDGSGNALLTFPEGETLTLQGITPAQMTGQQMMASGIPCYAPGTLIDTPDGPRAVETLKVGDLVETLDHGPQPIRWVRSGDLPLEEVDVDAKPVLIAAGALGKGLPTQDLIVSAQHRMFVGGGGQLDGWFKTEALAPAKSLTSLQGIRHMKGKQTITWIHFACDRHEVVTANGCLSESLLLGPMVVNGLTRMERKALADSIGLASTPDAALNGPPARECLKVGKVRRHLAECLKEKQRSTAKEIKKWDIDLAMEQWEVEQLGLIPSMNQTRNRELGAA